MGFFHAHNKRNEFISTDTDKWCNSYWISYLNVTYVQEMTCHATNFISVLACVFTDLRASVAASKATLAAVYSDSLMNKTPYYLHAVLVHQGEASRGHYWAYTRKHPSLSLETSIPPLPPRSSPSSSVQPSLQCAQMNSSTPRGTEIQKSVGSAFGANVESPVQPDIVNSGGVVAYHRQSETGEVCLDMTLPPDSAPSPAESGSSASHGVGGGEGMEVEKGAQPSVAELSASSVEDVEDTWIKFNDVSVSEVNWESVRQESLGGTRGNTSAYCLVYLNRELHENWLEGGKWEGKGEVKCMGEVME